MDANIRATIAHAVRFALAAIWLCAIGNGVMLLFTLIVDVPSRPDLFARGFFLAVATAFIAFGGMQAEQVARLADAAAVRSAHHTIADARIKRSIRAWRLTSFFRVGGITALLGSLIYLCSGLVVVVHGGGN